MPMILGHQRQIDFFNKILARGKLAHAYLFCGPEHIGKFLFARTLAKALVCADNSSLSNIQKVCGSCVNCRAVEENLHPEVIVLDRAHTISSRKEKRTEIPIEDVRELKRRFSYIPVSHRWRVGIINEAEKMSNDAANAFLKLLEEPGERTVFFLISAYPEMLLPTIVSRTQLIQFSLISHNILLFYLGQQTKGKSLSEDAILVLAGGRAGLVMDFLESRENLEREKKLAETIQDLLQKGGPEVFVFTAKAASDAELFKKTTEYVLRNLRKRMLSCRNPRDLILTVNKLKQVNKIAEIMGTTNVNPRLALDVLFLEAQVC